MAVQTLIHRCLPSIGRLPANLLALNWRPQQKQLQQSRSFVLTISQLTGRRYTEQHEWIQVSGDIGTVGVTDYAQGALGDVVYAQLPEPDSQLEQMADCGALESVKAASELYCPVSGTVTEKNTAVEETPALINQSPYDKGWLFKIRLSEPKQVDALLDEAGYETYLKNAGH